MVSSSVDIGFQKTTLSNGLRILTCNMPQTYSVSVGIFIGAGSRYESDQEAGISHFLEHMLFKGTAKRPTAKEITSAIEGLGGILNAGTDRESTVYWSRVARPHMDIALDVLADIVRNPRFDPDEIEKERKVILEELNMINDSPQSRVDLLIDEVFWPNQPLGRDVGGTKESVGSLSRDQLIDYMHRQYSPSNTVISVAGDISHGEVVEKLEPYLGDWGRTEAQPLIPAQNGQDAARLRVERRKSEQAHIALGVRGLPSLHPDRYALDLLSVVLGEGMSSRLFQELRERRALAYEVHSFVQHFLDSGAFMIYLGVDPSNAAKATEAVLEELRKLRDGISEEELSSARELSKGRLMLRMEDTRAVSGWLGAQELLMGQVRRVDEVVAMLDSITPEDLRRVALQLLVSEKLNMAVVGPFRSERQFKSLLKL